MRFNYSTLLVDLVADGILLLTLNRREVHNAINSVMMTELLSFWNTVSDANDLRVIVITGSGDRAFCAGADLKERFNLDLNTWKEQHVVLQAAMKVMSSCPLPIISMVNGLAFGGGLELALASDFVYASKTSQFAQSEVKLGIMPGAMGTQNLPKALGARRARELAYTGEVFSAEQAHDWGLVNHLYPLETLKDETVAVAKKIALSAPLAVRQVKRSINKAVSDELISGYEFEVSCYNSLLDSADRLEGIAAFNEKRLPDFKGV